MQSYSIFTFECFPERANIETTTQINALGYTPLVTKFEYSHDVGNFEKYNVRHFQEVKFTGTPYSHGDRIDEVTELYTFDAYIQRQLQMLLMRYNKKISNTAVKRLSNDNPQFRFERQQLDLKRLIQEFKTVYGTYFRNIQVPNVRSGALFGPDVDRSQLFRHLKSIGSISHIRTVVDLEGIEYNVGISSDYTITIYASYSEREELKVIQFLKDILDKGVLTSPLEQNHHDDEGDLENDTQLLL